MVAVWGTVGVFKNALQKKWKTVWGSLRYLMYWNAVVENLFRLQHCMQLISHENTEAHLAVLLSGVLIQGSHQKLTPAAWAEVSVRPTFSDMSLYSFSAQRFNPNHVPEDSPLAEKIDTSVYMSVKDTAQGSLFLVPFPVSFSLACFPTVFGNQSWASLPLPAGMFPWSQVVPWNSPAPAMPVFLPPTKESFWLQGF